MTEDTPDDELEFNADHAEKHLAGAAEHAGKLRDHFADNYPPVSRWLKGLDEVTAPAGEGQREAARPLRKGDGETITAQMANCGDDQRAGGWRAGPQPGHLRPAADR